MKEQKCSELVSNMPLAYASHQMLYNDSGEAFDYRFLDVNAAFEALTGLAADEVVGKNLSEVLPHSELYWIQKYAECIRTGERVYYENYSKPLSKYFQVIAFKSGEDQFTTLFFDISDSKEEFKKSEEIASFFQTITENASDGVVVLDSTQKYTYISPNAYKMFGYDSSEKFTLNPYELTHPDDLEFVASEINKTIQDPKYKPTLEYRYLKKSGEWLWIESKFSNLFSNPNINGFVINFKDITERKANLERLKYISDLQNVVIEIGSKFMNSSLYDVDNQINSALKILGRFVNADRIYIFSYDYELKQAINTYEWCSNNVEPQIENLQHVPFEVMGYWPEKHAKGEVIEIPDMDFEENEDVKKALSEQGIKSLIAFPIFQNNRCIGFAEVDSVDKMRIFDQNIVIIFKLFLQQLSDYYKKLNAESLLKINEARYRLTQEVGGVGSWEYSISKNKYWNSYQFRKLFGIIDEKITDLDEIHRLVQSTICNPPLVQQALTNLINDEKPYDLEFEIIRLGDGEKRVLYSHAQLVFDLENNETIVRGIVRDITTRLDREQKLKKSEALLAATLRHGRFSIWSVDLNHKLIYINETFTNEIFHTFGIKLEVGMELLKVLPQQMHALWLDRYKRTFANQSFIEEDVIELNEKKIYTEISSIPIIVDGEVIGGSFYGEDITYRKVAEQKLVQNAENLSVLLKASNEFVKPKDLYVNYNRVTNDLRELTGARYVVFNQLYDGYSKTISLSGLDNSRDIIKKYLNIDIVNEKWKRQEAFEAKWMHQKLTVFKDISSILFTDFNATLINLIIKNFNIGNVAIVRIEGNEKVVGNLIFIYEKGKTMENPELIEMFSYQLGQFIERLKAEEALIQKMNEMERFHKLTINRELNMIELKKEVNELLKKMGQEERYRIVG